MNTPYSGEPVESDAWPPLGQHVRVLGVISTTYLRAGETMVVRWSDQWRYWAEQGFCRITDLINEPSATELFPTLDVVQQMIAEQATTLPGEKILTISAGQDGVSLDFRVGVELDYSRVYNVVVPQWEGVVDAAALAAQTAQDAADLVATAQTDVQQAADQAAQSVLQDLQAQVLAAETARGQAQAAQTAAEDARDRAEAAADQTDVQPASPTVTGIVRLTGDLGGTATAPTVPGLAGKANTTHTHTAVQISDATSVGRDVLRAASAAAARSAIGAGTGTSNLAIGTTASTAMAGNRIQLVASLPTSPVAGVLYLIEED